MSVRPSSRGQTILEYLLVASAVVVLVFYAFSGKGSVLRMAHDEANMYFEKGGRAIVGGHLNIALADLNTVNAFGNFMAQEPTPINGGWCAWGACIDCYQERECACPRPAFGGAYCKADTTGVGVGATTIGAIKECGDSGTCVEILKGCENPDCTNRECGAATNCETRMCGDCSENHLVGAWTCSSAGKCTCALNCPSTKCDGADDGCGGLCQQSCPNVTVGGVSVPQYCDKGTCKTNPTTRCDRLGVMAQCNPDTCPNCQDAPCTRPAGATMGTCCSPSVCYKINAATGKATTTVLDPTIDLSCANETEIVGTNGYYFTMGTSQCGTDCEVTAQFGDCPCGKIDAGECTGTGHCGDGICDDGTNGTTNWAEDFSSCPHDCAPGTMPCYETPTVDTNGDGKPDTSGPWMPGHEYADYKPPKIDVCGTKSYAVYYCINGRVKACSNDQCGSWTTAQISAFAQTGASCLPCSGGAGWTYNFDPHKYDIESTQGTMTINCLADGTSSGGFCAPPNTCDSGILCSGTTCCTVAAQSCSGICNGGKNGCGLVCNDNCSSGICNPDHTCCVVNCRNHCGGFDGGCGVTCNGSCPPGRPNCVNGTCSR